MRTVAVIPARYASTRLPGKALLPICGKPIVQHVWEKVARCPGVDDLLVATDDIRILQAVEAFGGKAVMTSPDHPSGTDRIAEALQGVDADVVVNVQGDEPLIESDVIRAALEPLRVEPDVVLSTVCSPIRSLEDYLDPNCVKVVKDTRGNALYFSRLPIPFRRDPGGNPVEYGERLRLQGHGWEGTWRHVGLYIFRRIFLDTFVALPPSPLEESEKLEQLRALENGYPIRVVEVTWYGEGVDTPDDYARLRRRMEGEGAGHE